MLTLNFTKPAVEISVIQEDEDRKIEKLEEHKRLKLLILKIAENEGVQVKSTYNDDSNGDFVFDENDVDSLKAALDKHLKKYKI